MLRFIRAAAVAAILLALHSIVANATGTRVFVSGAGSDTGNCDRAAPCRSFNFAMGPAGVGGEIVVLDSAGYGTVTISQSLTITNPGGVEAGISTSGASAAITISAAAGTEVVLRGLTIEGNGVGTNGILVNPVMPEAGSNATVDIIDCVIKDFTQNGIDVVPSGNFTPEILVIDHTRLLNNGGNGLQIAVAATPIVDASINGTTIDNNNMGIVLGGAGGAPTIMSNSHVDYNQFAGITVSGPNILIMKSSTALENDSGLGADVSNSGFIEVVNNNTIKTLDNSGTGVTDGSNNIESVGGTALTKQAQQ